MTTAEILKKYRKITVLGLSPNEARPSYYVSEYMRDHGYEIVGVNPGQTEILGRPVYAKISDVPGVQEIVAVFRASEFLAGIVDELRSLPILNRPKVLWIQLGINDPEVESKAEEAGMMVVRNRCLMVEHRAM